MNKMVHANIRCIGIYFLVLSKHNWFINVVYIILILLRKNQYEISAEMSFIFKSCIWDVDKTTKLTDGYAQSRETLLFNSTNLKKDPHVSWNSPFNSSN
jgi:hypothetical protein